MKKTLLCLLHVMNSFDSNGNPVRGFWNVEGFWWKFCTQYSAAAKHFPCAIFKCNIPLLFVVQHSTSCVRLPFIWLNISLSRDICCTLCNSICQIVPGNEGFNDLYKNNRKSLPKLYHLQSPQQKKIMK